MLPDTSTTLGCCSSPSTPHSLKVTRNFQVSVVGRDWGWDWGRPVERELGGKGECLLIVNCEPHLLAPAVCWLAGGAWREAEAGRPGSQAAQCWAPIPFKESQSLNQKPLKRNQALLAPPPPVPRRRRSSISQNCLSSVKPFSPSTSPETSSQLNVFKKLF